MLELEPGAEENALFQNARFDVRMADGAEQNGGELPQFVQHAVRQHLAGAQVSVAADIVVGVVEFEGEFFRSGIEDFDCLADDFRPRAVAADDCKIIAFH